MMQVALAIGVRISFPAWDLHEAELLDRFARTQGVQCFSYMLSRVFVRLDCTEARADALVKEFNKEFGDIIISRAYRGRRHEAVNTFRPKKPIPFSLFYGSSWPMSEGNALSGTMTHLVKALIASGSALPTDRLVQCQFERRNWISSDFAHVTITESSFVFNRGKDHINTTIALPRY